MGVIDIRRHMPHLFWPLLAISLLAYFGYHLVEGERGLKAWGRLNLEIAAAKANLARLESEKQLLEHDVSLLRPDRLDPDMLDERVRAVLNLAAPDEVIIFNKPAAH